MRSPAAAPRPLRALLLTVLACSVLLEHPRAAQQGAGPPSPPQKWTLQRALDLPDWITVGGQFRLQFEVFDEGFRQENGGNAFLARTLFDLTLHAGPWFATGELADSRALSTSSDLPLDTSLVNALELLQGHVGWRDQDLFAEEDEVEVKIGRQTLNLAGRRLVARQRFRNTINNFTGAYAHWGNSAGDEVHSFLFLPVRRLPTEQERLEDNDPRSDDESSNVRFWGVHAKKKRAIGDADLEAYIYGLDEQDGRDLATRNRDFVTFGTRIFRAPQPGELYADVEVAFQTGTNRVTSSASATEDLDHQAEFAHLTAGYQFPGELKPRAEFVFEFASGDTDPNDDEFGRFDQLFGARRPDYGPPSTLGAFQRSNIVTPGLRFFLKPRSDIELMLQDRFFYLAESRDVFVTTGLQDPTGASGDYLGNLVELRLRWNPDPNFGFEVGFAHIFTGSFTRDVPGSTSQGDTSFAYVTTKLTF